MDRAFASGAAGVPPTAPVAPSIGYSTPGDPATSTPATKPGKWWYHMVTEEIRAVIVAAGLTPDHTNVAQLAQAIQQLINAGGIKMPVRAATTANIAALAGGAPNTLDGVALAANDRILVKDQATGCQNGIYVVSTLGTGANGTWTRATDADGVGELFAGLLVVVQEGTASADAIWELSTDGAITIGATSLSFVRKDSVAGSALGVRQTVLSGPVDANGYPSFGGAAGGTTVTAAGTLIAAAANGFGASGAVDRIGSIVNPSWTGLSTNGVMYLYLDIAANGTCTPGSTTLLPAYQFGGAYNTTNNQHTFNTQEMVMKVGNGAAATQVYRVFVGEVTVAGGVVTAITWYALQGRYRSQFSSCSVGLVTSSNDNLGGQQKNIKFFLKCTTAEFNYGVGDIVQDHLNHNISGAYGVVPVADGRNTSKTVISGSLFAAIPDKSSGAVSALTPANWQQSILVERGW